MKYELKTITPVHIGTGEKLSQIDGFYADRLWYRVNLDSVLTELPESQLNPLTIQMGKRDFRWDKRFQSLDLTADPFCAYALDCPEDPGTTEIREAIKDVFNHPMIPGSSIKGAIRTAVLWDMMGSDKNAQQFAVDHLKSQLQRKPNRSWVGQPIERRVFGKDPNHDLMRAVQVSDAQLLEVESLEMGAVWTVAPDRDNQLNQKQKIFVEQIRADQSLDLSIKIDKWLFRAREKKVLNFSDRQERVICEEMASVCNFAAKGIIEDECNFFDDYNQSELANFYESLLSRLEELPTDAFVLPVGWGTGHHTKTVTDLVVEGDEAPDDFMMGLRQHYRLGKSRSGGDYYDPEFPKTRRILYHEEKPISPLGWVQITPKE